MKCKRCRTQISDDVDICPNCGQDLSSLRQLLENFYDQDLPQPEDQNLQPSIPSDVASPDKKESPMKTHEPRIMVNTDPSEYGDLPLADSTLEGSVEEAEDSLWENALRGGFWLRFMAFAIDHVILLLLLGIFTVVGFLTLAIGSGGGRGIPFLQQVWIILPTLIPLLVILPLVYFSFFHGAWGQTIGKMILGLRVIQTDGEPLSFSGALIRALAYIPSAIPLFLGFLWVGFTPSKHSWHDAIADTMVIREQWAKED